jgi:hypothetical protein
MSARARVAAIRLAIVTAGSLALLVSAPAAHAQPRDPLPFYVVDAQGSLPMLPDDDINAELRGLSAGTLPAWGPGFNLAAHVFPLRSKRISVGIGANYQWLRGTSTPDIPKDAGPDYDPGPTVTTKFVSFSPQLSLNFGHRRGWSYLSGGLGPSTLTVSRDDYPEEEGESQSTLSYGGGGRWFVRPHLAFSFDLRIYNVPVQEPSELSSGHASGRVVSLNIGVSFQ